MRRAPTCAPKITRWATKIRRDCRLWVPSALSCASKPPQTASQAYGWYTEYRQSEAAIAQACMQNNNQAACKQISLSVAAALVGGPTGDAVDEAEQLGATIIRVTPDKAIGYAGAGSAITGKEFVGLPDVWWGNAEKVAFSENLGTGYYAATKERVLTQVLINTPKGLGVAFVNVEILDRRSFGDWFVQLARQNDVQLIYFRIGE